MSMFSLCYFSIFKRDPSHLLVGIKYLSTFRRLRCEWIQMSPWAKICSCKAIDNISPLCYCTDLAVSHAHFAPRKHIEECNLKNSFNWYQQPGSKHRVDPLLLWQDLFEHPLCQLWNDFLAHIKGHAGFFSGVCQSLWLIGDESRSYGNFKSPFAAWNHAEPESVY